MAKHSVTNSDTEPTAVTETDPVAKEAADFAIAVTDTKKRKHPGLNKLIWTLVALFVVIGTFGAIIGFVNTVQLNTQQGVQKQEQKCQTELLDKFTKEQKVRSAIAADDRTAALVFARESTIAKTQDEKEDAYLKYLKQLKINDDKRAMYPVPTFDNTACKLTIGQAQRIGLIPSTSATPSQLPSKSSGSATSTTTSGQSASRSVSVTAPSSAQPSASGASQGKAPEPRTSIKTASRPQPTKTVVRTQPNTAPTTQTPGLITVPGCTITVLDIRIC